MAVLMLAIGSAMLLAARAMPDARTVTGAIVDAGAALEQFMTELQYAVSVENSSATMIEFTVADRDGNDIPEVIRYEWSGTAGASLTRRYNGGAAVRVLDDVREFALSYDLEAMDAGTPQNNESAEMALAGFDALQHTDGLPIKSSEWYGQYFLPALPADAVSWKVTRIRIHGRTDGSSSGESRVQLRLPTAGRLPSGTVLEEKTLMESSFLAGYSEQEFSFLTVTGLSPTQGLCIVVKWISDLIACQLRGYHEGASATDSFLVKTTDGGATWSAPAGCGLKYTVYGTVTTVGMPPVQNACCLHRISIRLRTGTDSQATVQCGVRMLNNVEMDP